jgi:hypothetical protein
MTAKLLIDHLLLEMPQFRLQKPTTALTITCRSWIWHKPPFDLMATAHIQEEDKTFKVRAKIPEADQKEIMGFYKNFWQQRPNLLQKYQPQLLELEQAAREKAMNWWNRQNNQSMARVETIKTGVTPSHFVKYLDGYKYVWIKSTHNPSDTAETLGAFMDQRMPGEKLVRIDQQEKIRNTRTSSLYVLVTPAQLQQLNRKIIELNRAKVARRL